MSRLLSGKTIMITGASKGIGKAAASLCASYGADLVLVARSIDLLNSLKDDISNTYGSNVKNFKCDVSNSDDLKTVFQQLNTDKILLDGLVNNAGVMIDAMLQVVKPEMIRQVYDTNVFAVMNTSQWAMKSMLRKRKGSIVNLTSIIGTNGNAGQVVYGSSKSAVIGITKSLSKELAPFNIRVNGIAPGFIDTEMTQNMDERFKEKNISAIGMKRIGTPEDVAKVIVFLLSDLSEYVTGQIIGVDGGMII